MTRKDPEHDPFFRARRKFEAAWARQDELAAGAEAERRLMLEIARRARTKAMRAHFPHLEEIERLRNRGSAQSFRRGPDDRKRRDGEEGEPAPVVPKPRPTPLSGAAAAPIE